MHGERGRVGLIVPSSNTTNEPECASALPADVSLHSLGKYTNGTWSNVAGGIVTLVVIWLGLRTLLSIANVQLL
ncbi:hypothetical protein [Halomicrococcus sp. SG-WS-1]|uniref:hypothetical protein n=1 Tax=Halomicrococcus sp. SG-WS-1 TaxID=3439057 RepID=UPI003F7ACF9B